MHENGLLTVFATLDAHEDESGAPTYDWELRYLVRQRGSVGEIVELAVRPSDAEPPQRSRIWADRPADTVGGIPMRLLRLSSRELLELVADFQVWAMSATTSDPAVKRRLQQWGDDFSASARPGRKGRPPVEYARVAQRYVQLLNDPKPLESLRAELGLSASQVRNVLYKARHDDLLTRAPKGRAGGELTQKAIDLLEQEG